MPPAAQAATPRWPAGDGKVVSVAADAESGPESEAAPVPQVDDLTVMYRGRGGAGGTEQSGGRSSVGGGSADRRRAVQIVAGAAALAGRGVRSATVIANAAHAMSAETNGSQNAPNESSTAPPTMEPIPLPR